MKKISFYLLFAVLFFLPVIVMSNQENYYNVEVCNCEIYNKKVKNIKNKKDLSKKLNLLGYNKYKEKKFNEAAYFFKCSFEADKNYTVAHYNYACALSRLLIETDNACDEMENDDLNYEIEKHLVLTIQLDPSRRKRIEEDPDFDKIRKYPYYYLLTLSPDLTAKEIITKVDSWHAQNAGGIFPGSPVVYFSNDGGIMIREFTFNKKSEEYIWIEKKGKFEMTVGNKFKITFNSKKYKDIKGYLDIKKEKGVVKSLYVKFEGKDETILYYYNTDYSDCGA